jgi:hypothetical protein
MDPMKVIIEMYVDEPVSNDIDELTDSVRIAVEQIVGEADYTVADIGLSFELHDE